MRFTHIVLITICLLVFIASCDNFLETEAPSQVSLSEFWNSPDEARLGVTGIYDAAQDVFELNYWRWGELRADNYIKSDRPPTDIQHMIDNGLTPNTSGSDWTGLYTLIASANIAIDRIPDIAEFDDQDDLLAQALTLRALAYFYAVRVWGDIPAITEPVTDLEILEGRSRSSVNEIFNNIIIPDIQQAEELISITRSQTRPRNEIALGSILALKSHIYMWPGNHQDYTIARDAISRIESLGYSLETTESGWINIFRGSPQDSDEIVFALGWNFNEDGGNSGIGLFVPATPVLVPPERLEQKWRDAIPGDDFRILSTATFDIEIESETEFPLFRILTKYSGSFEDQDRDIQGLWGRTNERDIIFYRLSGLLLLKAEAENNLGNTDEAISLLNRVREARGLETEDQNISDPAIVRDLILNERQFELMGEGHRFWDLIRNNVVFDVMEPINGMNNDNEILWPISQNVLNRNENIEQNPGY